MSELSSYVDSTYTGALDMNGKFTGEGELVYGVPAAAAAATGDGTPSTPSTTASASATASAAGPVRYVGSFRDGQFHGEGTLLYPSGSKYKAVWDSGVEVPGTGSYVWSDGLPFNVTAEWNYVVPFDRRLWPEHRDGKRADVAYKTERKRVQTKDTFQPS
jgi:hypothetical protein